LMGRQMQKDAGQKPQVVMTMPLLEGLDGVRKMSKSYGNHVGLNDPPNEMFGKLMSIPDSLTLKYAELLTDDDLAALKILHPMQAKKHVARGITAQYWGTVAADEALNHFERVFSRKEAPDECPEFIMSQARMKAHDILVASGLVPSKKEARRLLEQGGVQCDTQKISVDQELDVDKPVILKVGKRRFMKLIPFSTK
jgi:tyrosyl-tRNA synthetase